MADSATELPATGANVYRASGRGDAVQLAKLLHAGAAANFRDSALRTPLMFAALNDSPEMLRLLLDHGADIEAKNEDEVTALVMAIRYENTKAVRVLLEWGADVETKSEEGLTPIMWAAGSECSEVVAQLLEHGADVDAENNGGRNAEAQCDHPDCLRVLQGAESLQRWHRRRLLVAWRH